jgi:ABC-type transporter Mla MlaB component
LIQLDPRLTQDAAVALWDQISAHPGALALDASQVRHLSAAALQVLLVAARRAPLRLDAPSDALCDALTRLGAGDLIGGAA